jgi:hypothetical protein
MPRFWTRLQLTYLGIFLAATAAVFIYQAIYVWPIQNCEKNGGWWAPKWHECATPMPVSRFTGHLPTAAGQVGSFPIVKAPASATPAPAKAP